MNTVPINKVYNLIILDESGSMEYIRQPPISGFNELPQSIQHSATENPDIPVISIYSSALSPVKIYSRSKLTVFTNP